MSQIVFSLLVPLALTVALSLSLESRADENRPTYGIRVVKNIVYGKGLVGDINDTSKVRLKDLLLDAYLPVDTDAANKPALLLAHGGAFRGGDKSDERLREVAGFFASRGYVCFSYNFRLHRDLPPTPRLFKGFREYPAVHAAVVDTKRVIRWVRAHSKQYGIDPERIAGLGDSAGSVSLLAAAVSGPEDFSADGPDDPARPLNYPNESAKLQAVVDCWGTADFFLDQFDHGDPPILIFHGTKDREPTTPFKAAKRIKARCDKVGIPCVLYPLEGAGHTAWEEMVNGKTIAEVAFEFLERYLAPGRAATNEGSGETE